MTASSVSMSIQLNGHTQEKLEALAARQKRSAQALASEAIQDMIEKKEREYAWQESCDAALQRVDETGLHATHEEVMAWIDSWGTDKEQPAPVCHR